MLNSNQLPPLFNIPKSQLQCYGELVYSNNNHLLSKCGASSISALERFVCVVAWSISAVRPLAFGVTPYNPILGETHHVSTANLNVLLEQVYILMTNYFKEIDETSFRLVCFILSRFLIIRPSQLFTQQTKCKILKLYGVTMSFLHFMVLISALITQFGNIST